MNHPITCELSGESPIEDAVVTPSGHICSKRLLLSKLVETNNLDPFSSSTSTTPLDESSLISLAHPPSISTPQPPKLPSAASLPSLLTQLQSAYDAHVLELYDTRRALEETRRELSDALYQNDAAVRVIARLVAERDVAREELARWSATVNVPQVGGKRKRETGDEDGGEDGNVNVVEMEEEKEDKDEEEVEEGVSRSIPERHVEEMSKTWKELSSKRRSSKKKSGSGVTPSPSWETLSSEYQLASKKSYHKSSCKAGILSLACKRHLVVTAGRDKQLVLYDANSETVRGSVGCKVAVAGVDCLDLFWKQEEEDDENVVVVMAGTDGVVRMYQGTELKRCAQGICKISLEKTEEIVGVTIHPTGKHVLVATTLGTIYFLAWNQKEGEGEDAKDTDGTLEVAAVFGGTTDDDPVRYTCMGLHPDGLILGLGTDDGKLCVWDLKSQKLASTLQGNTPNPIQTLAFSENGYHVATSSSTDGKISVWDLRKQTIIASLPNTNQSATTTTTTAIPIQLAFCPNGKYLAYKTTMGDISLVVVKDWNKTVTWNNNNNNNNVPLDNKNEKETNVSGGGGGLAWGGGGDGMGLVSCCDSERMVQFWGVVAKDP